MVISDGDDDDEYHYDDGNTDEWCRCSPGKLVAVVQLDHGSGHHVKRGVGAPTGILV